MSGRIPPLSNNQINSTNRGPDAAILSEMPLRPETPPPRVVVLASAMLQLEVPPRNRWILASALVNYVVRNTLSDYRELEAAVEAAEVG